MLKFERQSFVLRVAVAMLAALPACAADVGWDGGAVGTRAWSAPANWNPDGDPAGNDIRFDNAGATNAFTVSSIVDASYSIDSLRFTNTSPNYHMIWIDAGRTLSVTGSVVGVGYTNVLIQGSDIGNSSNRIAGPGAFVVSNRSASVEIQCLPLTAVRTNWLDLSGLATLVMDVRNLRIAYPYSSYGYVWAAATNTIIAQGEISVGGSPTDAQANSALHLGLVNTLRAADIYIARGRATQNTMIDLQGDGADATVVIRGAAGGTNRANLHIGRTLWADPGARGWLDFEKATADALLGTVLMGEGCWGRNGDNSTARGFLYLNTGTVDATSVHLGLSTAGHGTWGIGAGQGFIYLGGGLLRADTIMLANRTAAGEPTSGSSNRGVINLGGGTLQVRVVTNGPGALASREIHWTNGVLQNFPGADSAIHGLDIFELANPGERTLLVQTGCVFSINSGLSGGGGLVKDDDGLLLLNADNTYTGHTIVARGALGGTGSLNAPLNVATDGVLAPGPPDAIGAFRVASEVTIAGELRVQLNVAAPGSNDVLEVGGDLTLGPASRLVVEAAALPVLGGHVIVTYAGELHGRFGSVSGLPPRSQVLYSAWIDNAIVIAPPSGTRFMVR